MTNEERKNLKDIRWKIEIENNERLQVLYKMCGELGHEWGHNEFECTDGLRGSGVEYKTCEVCGLETVICYW